MPSIPRMSLLTAEVLADDRVVDAVVRLARGGVPLIVILLDGLRHILVLSVLVKRRARHLRVWLLLLYFILDMAGWNVESEGERERGRERGQ